MGVEEGAFASGPVLRGGGAHYFFDIFGRNVFSHRI